MIIINSRFLTQKITGTQRFAIEISLQLKRLMPNDTVFVSPKNILHKDIAEELNVKPIGVNKGHLWEQLDLTVYLKKVGNPLLINLVNTAPLLYEKQIITIHDLAFLRHPDAIYLHYKLLTKIKICLKHKKQYALPFTPILTLRSIVNSLGIMVFTEALALNVNQNILRPYFWLSLAFYMAFLKVLRDELRDETRNRR